MVIDLAYSLDKLWPFDLISTHLFGKWKSNRNQLPKSPFKSIKTWKTSCPCYIIGSGPMNSIGIGWPWQGNNVGANHEYHFVTTVHMHITDRSASKFAIYRHKIRYGSRVLFEMPTRWHLGSWVIATAETVPKCLGTAWNWITVWYGKFSDSRPAKTCF